MELVNILYRVDAFFIFTFAFVYKAGLYDRKPEKAFSFPLSLSHYQDIDDDEVVKGGAGIWLVLPEAGDDSNFGCSPLGEGRLCVQECVPQIQKGRLCVQACASQIRKWNSAQFNCVYMYKNTNDKI